MYVCGIVTKLTGVDGVYKGYVTGVENALKWIQLKTVTYFELEDKIELVALHIEVVVVDIAEEDKIEEVEDIVEVVDIVGVVEGIEVE